MYYMEGLESNISPDKGFLTFLQGISLDCKLKNLSPYLILLCATLLATSNIGIPVGHTSALVSGSSFNSYHSP